MDDKMRDKSPDPMTASLLARIAELERSERALRKEVQTISKERDALWKNERHFQRLYEKAPDPYQSLDMRGDILIVNEKWLKILGYSYDEVIGRPFGEFLTPESNRLYKRQFEIFKSDGAVSDIEFEMVCKDGHVISVLYDGQIIYDDQGKSLQTDCIFSDITEKKRIEYALKESEKRYQVLYDNSPDMYVSVSPVDATVMICNETLLEKTGYIKEEIIGSPVFKLYHEDALEDAEDAFEQYISTGLVENKTLALKTKDGKKIDVALNVNAVRDEKGKILYNFSSWRDITKEKRLEHKFRDLLNNLSVGVVIHAPDTSILSHNPKAEELLGVSAAKMLGTSADHAQWLFLSEDESVLPLEEYPVNKVLSTKKMLKNFMVGVVRPDRSKVTWVLTNGYPVYDHERSLVEVVINFIDITEIREAQVSLRRNEAKIRSIFTAAPIGIGLVSERTITEVNETLCEMTGYTRDELLGKNARMLYIDDEEYERVGLERYRQIQLEGSGHVETKFRRKDGDHIDILLSSTPLDRSDFSIGVTFTALDITDAKVTARKLEESAEELRRAQQVAHIGNWSFTLIDSRIEWSDELYHIFGRDRGPRLTYELFTSWIHPEDRARHESYMQKMLMVSPDDGLETLKYRIVRPDGTLRWAEVRTDREFDERGSLLRFFGTLQDVTDKEEILRQLEQKKTQLETIMKDAPNPMMLHSEDGEVMMVNTVWETLTGYRAEEIDTIDKWTKKAYGERMDVVKEDIARRYARKEKASDGEYTITTKDGRSLIWQFSSAPLGFIDGRRTVFTSAMDITELKKKDELMILQSRYAAMGEMIAMIAHQWRQPLSVISMSMNNVLADFALETSSESTIIEQSRLVLEETRHLTQTIDDFRDFFLPDKKKEHISVLSMLEETRKVVGPSLSSKGIELRIDDTDEKSILTYRRELIQVFLNLINNAKDAVVAHAKRDRKIKITVGEQKGSLSISVCDNGGGIDEGIIKKVFDPYFSTKENINGTGLGLYMSKTIIEQHLGGQLRVVNSDEGACFIISLPGG